MDKQITAQPGATPLPMQVIQPNLPVGVAVYYDARLQATIEAGAKRMAASTVLVPSHLHNKPDACFGIIVYALTWNLNPYAVAAATYQPTEGGRIAFEGKLVQAILESSHALEGGVHFEHYGDWSKVQGKFEIKQNDKGRKFAVPRWTDEDARAGGCGVKVWAKLRGEDTARTINFDLVQAQPRNSTLWATDPKTQIQYTAVRRFGNTACPGLIMGVPFDAEDNAEPIEREVKGEVIMPTSTDEEPPTITATDVLERQMEENSEAPATPAGGATASSPDNPAASEPINEGQLRVVRVKLNNAALSEADYKTRFGFASKDTPVSQLKDVLAWIDQPMGG